MSNRKAKNGVDFVLDPETSRAKFLHNNKAALKHGGYSTHVPEAIIDAALDTDLGLEVGYLKGQIVNMLTLGEELIQELYDNGDKAQALSVSLSCADRAARIVPQIQRAIESQENRTSGLTTKQINLRKRILKKMSDKTCSALEAAHLFEINGLGELPRYGYELLQLELKADSQQETGGELSREEIQQILADYWRSTSNEASLKAQRNQDVAEIKRIINHSMFSTEQVNDEQ